MTRNGASVLVKGGKLKKTTSKETKKRPNAERTEKGEVRSIKRRKKNYTKTIKEMLGMYEMN